MAKQIYFVRHGITVANEKNLVQDANDPLSERGFEQAEFLAERLTRIVFEKLLASDMQRAKQTAEIIAAKTGHVPEFSALFREVIRPAKFHGISRADERIVGYRQLQDEKRKEDSHWKLAEEESLTELMERAHRAFAYAAEQPENNVVVVTHGHFLRIMVMLRFLGDDFPKHWKESSLFLATSNTGITLFRRGEEEEPEWQLVTWNDHAHLG